MNSTALKFEETDENITVAKAQGSSLYRRVRGLVD
jgi:hypothetical protein